MPRGPRGGLSTVRTYGTAAGIDVVLLTEADPDTVAPLRVSLVASAPIGLEDLAVFPNSAEGRNGADVIGAAVVHALEIVDLGAMPGGAA